MAANPNPNGQIKIIVAGGFFSRNVEAFDEKTNSWRHLPQMTQCRFEASSVVYADDKNVRIFVIGGRGIPISVEELDLSQKNGHWIESSLTSSELPFQELYRHVCVIHGSRILAFGGYYNNMSSDTVYEIQLKKESPYTSKIVGKMLRPICYHGAVKFADKVYIIGGIQESATRNDVLSTVLEYDLKTNTCKGLKPLDDPVSHTATTVWNESVIILGGKDKNGRVLNTAISYNLNSQRSVKLENMKKERANCTAVTMGDKIVVMGGEDESGNKLKLAECFNFSTGIWMEFPAKTDAIAYATAVKIKHNVART